MNEKRRINTTFLTEMGLLIALILLLAFTPLGYIKTLGLEITLIVVPVAVGAVVLGPTAGALLGFIFGVTSFIQCFGMSAFGTALMGINPIFTFITCVVSRILAGWLSALIYKGLYRFPKSKFISYPISCLSGSLLNTLFFVGMVIAFFANSSYLKDMMGVMNIFAFAVAFAGINSLIEAGVTTVIGAAVAGAISKTKILDIK